MSKLLFFLPWYEHNPEHGNTRWSPPFISNYNINLITATGEDDKMYQMVIIFYLTAVYGWYFILPSSYVWKNPIIEFGFRISQKKIWWHKTI